MTEPTPVPDPFTMWRDWLNQSERQWNAYLNEAMSTDEFSQAMGRMMDVYLNMQKSMNEVMGRYFSAINIPTRTDVLSLGNRIGEVEERLASIERTLQTVAAASGAVERKSTAASPVARPPRTKKPTKS